MGCACKGIKMVLVGALLVINDQKWFGVSVSEWLLVGVILIVLGALKIIMPPCSSCCKAKAPAKPAKKGR